MVWEEDTRGRVRVYVGAEWIVMNIEFRALFSQHKAGTIEPKGIMLTNIKRKADSRHCVSQVLV